MIGIGSRVYMETTREDSMNRLNKRLEGIEEAGKTYQESLQKAQQDYMTVRERAESLRSNEAN